MAETEVPPQATVASLWRLRRAESERAPSLSGDAIPKAFTALILLVIVALLAMVLYMTFVPTLPTSPGFTLSHWARLGSRRLLTQVIPNTVIVGFTAITVATLFAVPMAWFIGRTSIPFKRLFTSMIMVVAVVPGYAVAMGWILLLDARVGFLNRFLMEVFGIAHVPLTITNNIVGIGWVMGLVLTPAMYFLVAAPIAAIDPSLGESASVSGASALKAFLRVDLPLITPAVLGGLIYVFMSAVSIFEIPALLGAASGKTPVLASEVFYAVRPGGPTATFTYGAAGVYGLLLAVPSLAALAFYLRLLKRGRRYQVVTGKGYRQQRQHVGLLGYAAVGFILLYIALAVVLPAAALFWTSIMPYMRVPSLEALRSASFANYDGLYLSVGGADVIVNTLQLVVSVALAVVFLSCMVSWLVVRGRTRFRGLVDALAMVPHAIPGLAFAFALAMLAVVLSASVPWLPFAGTLFIIAIAHVINRLPYGTRVTNAAIVQLHRDLDEAAEVAGASRRVVLRRIILPLIRPALVYLGIWTALLSFQEVSMALFLSAPQNRVLSVSIWDLWQGGRLGPAAAATVMVMVVQFALLLVLLFRLGPRPGYAEAGSARSRP